MRVTKHAAFAAALVLCLATASRAQGPPRPGPEHQALDFFTGEWTFEAEMKPGPMGPGGKVTSTDSCRFIEGGFAVFCQGRGENPMGKTESVAIMSYDSDKEVYTYYGVETGSPVAHAEGKRNGDTWTYLTEQGGMKAKVTIAKTSENAYSFKFELSQDGTSWFTVMEGAGRRQS